MNALRGGRTLMAAAALILTASAAPSPTQTFVVLGHIRGGHQYRLNPKLGYLLARVKALHPDFVVVCGDMIWGDIDAPNKIPRHDVVVDEWNAVDSALATLGVPVYRTPGNHDLLDVQSRDIWNQRYGALPRVVTVGHTRLILLVSAFIPPNGDTTHMKYIEGVDIDPGQVSWLQRQLADTGYAHTFVFMHHLLWWETPGGKWWRDVHPLLAHAHVDDVFSGDYGPMKFSHMEKDGVKYWQGSMELQTPLEFLQRSNRGRLLSSQFDTFFEVRVAGDSSSVIIHTANETWNGDFTPDRWRAIDEPPPLTLRERWGALRRDQGRLHGLLKLAGGMLVVGFVAGWWLGRRRDSPV